MLTGFSTMLKHQLKQWRVHNDHLQPRWTWIVYSDTWSLELVLDVSSLHSIFLLKQRGALDEAETLIEQQLLSPVDWWPPWKSSCTPKALPGLLCARINPWEGAERGKGSPENRSGRVKVNPSQGESVVQKASFREKKQPQNLQSPTVHTKGTKEKGQHLFVCSLLYPC